MSNKWNLEKLCSVKKEDFDKIFDDFFIVRNIKQDELEKKIDTTKIYTNYEIKKIEIKDWLTYEDFIWKLIDKLNSYYYDWDKSKDKDIVDSIEATKDLNQYSPKIWMWLEDFEKSDIWNKKWIEFIQKNGKKICFEEEIDKEELKLIINFLRKQKLLDISNINKSERYIIVWKNNKIYFPTSKQLLWYLHWDIWEFILFFLVEWYLKKPILFSKVQHCKSSSWDKVKWSDWIHISYENWNAKFIFLESKFRNDFISCVDETIDSQEEFLINKWEWDLDNEIRILFKERFTIDWLWFYNDIFENWFEKYINPYRRNEVESSMLPFELVSWIIYELWDKYKENYLENETVWRIEKILIKYKNINTLLKGKKITIFLFPLVSDEKLIKLFLEKIKY